MLTQAEADALIAMEKHFIQLLPVTLRPGKNQSFELNGFPDAKERFLLDLWRGSIKLTKYRFQNRGRKVVVLVRLELNAAPHTNPDGTRIGGTPLHVYREGYEDRWAVPVFPDQFQDVSSMRQTFDDFCQYCNISERPPFQEELM